MCRRNTKKILLKDNRPTYRQLIVQAFCFLLGIICMCVCCRICCESENAEGAMDPGRRENSGLWDILTKLYQFGTGTQPRSTVPHFGWIEWTYRFATVDGNPVINLVAFLIVGDCTGLTCFCIFCTFY